MYEILQAKKYFNFLINNYPNTDYANDSIYKMEYIIEIIAQKKCIWLDIMCKDKNGFLQ